MTKPDKIDTRSTKDIKKTIQNLLDEAERVARVSSRQQANNFGQPANEEAAHELPDKAIKKYLDGLDVLISEEATLALRAEFIRFSSIFDTDKTRDTIREAITEVTKPLIQEWVDKHMPDIARNVVAEAISKIADAGHLK